VYADTNTADNTDAYTIGYTYRNGDCYSQCNSDGYSYSETNTQATPNTAASPDFSAMSLP